MAEEEDRIEVKEETAAGPAVPTDQAAPAEGVRPNEPVGEARAWAGTIDSDSDGAVADDIKDRGAVGAVVFGAAEAAHALTVLPVLSATEAVAPWTSRRAGRRVRQLRHKDTLPLLHWPDQAPCGSAAAHHYIETLLAPFLAGYRNPTTIRSYRKALRGFFAWWGRDGAAAPLTLTLLRAYQQQLRATVEPRTVNFYLAILRRFCGWLVEQGLLPWNPMEGITGLRIPKGFVRDSLTEEEIRRLLAVLPRDGETQRAQETVLRN